MKKILTGTLLVGYLLMIACKKEAIDPEEAYFHGLWQVTHMLTQTSEDTLSATLPQGYYTYHFEEDGNVKIYSDWDGTRISGWELPSPDSIVFSANTYPYFHITDKTENHFVAEYTVPQQAYFRFEFAR